MVDDEIINFLLSRYPPSYRGFVVDVGAAEGELGSLSRPLLERGWAGILVEPLPDFFRQLESLYLKRPDVRLVNVAASSQEGRGDLHPSLGCSTLHPEWKEACERAWTHVRYRPSIPVILLKLSTILNHQQAPNHIDVLTIDTEGHDFQVLQGMDWNREVDVLVMETLDMLHPTSNNVYPPKQEVIDFLAERKMVLVQASAGGNALFIRKGLFV